MSKNEDIAARLGWKYNSHKYWHPPGLQTPVQLPDWEHDATAALSLLPRFGANTSLEYNLDMPDPKWSLECADIDVIEFGDTASEAIVAAFLEASNAEEQQTNE